MKYEYNYRFTLLREIKTSYIYQIRPGKKNYLFEIRTSFIVKKTDGVYQIIDSEMYGTELHGVEESDVSKIFENKLIYRLKEYYMSKEEIDKFKHMSLVFAKQVEADPKYNLSDTISLVGNIEVCTIQKDNQTLKEFMGRAIRTESHIQIS
ncbi:hypothetical protein ABFS83_14G133900 [Erythranthe nasuta]